MMNYYEHTAALPPALAEINEKCWDMMGRPNYEHSYQISIGMLCAISDDWDSFIDNCKQFFYEYDRVNEKDLSLAWHCYVKGMVVLTEKLAERA